MHFQSLIFLAARLFFPSTVTKVTEYRRQARALVDNMIRKTEFTMPIDWNSPMWPVLMVWGARLRACVSCFSCLNLQCRTFYRPMRSASFHLPARFPCSKAPH